jgi:hypothetical protein
MILQIMENQRICGYIIIKLIFKEIPSYTIFPEETPWILLEVKGYPKKEERLKKAFC